MFDETSLVAVDASPTATAYPVRECVRPGIVPRRGWAVQCPSRGFIDNGFPPTRTAGSSNCRPRAGRRTRGLAGVRSRRDVGNEENKNHRSRLDVYYSDWTSQMGFTAG